MTKLKEASRSKKIPLADINVVGLDDTSDATHDLYDERVFVPINDTHQAIIDDMKANGFEKAHPVEVRRNTKTGRFDVVTGRQRVRCARAAGLTDVEGFVVTLKGPEALARILKENELRQQDNCLTKGRKVKRYLEADSTATEQSVAKIFGNNPQTIKNILNVVNKGVDELHDAIDEGLVADSVAYKLAIKDPDIQAPILEQLLAYDLNTDEAGKFIALADKAATDAASDAPKDEKTDAQKKAIKEAAKKAKLAKLYGPLGKKVAEDFVGRTAELSSEFLNGIRFVLEGFTVGEEGVVKGLKQAQENYCNEKGLS